MLILQGEIWWQSLLGFKALVKLDDVELSVFYTVSLAFRLGEITLGDFKEAIDRPGMFRYHFKALDPEFGTVKEEVWGVVYTFYRV